MAGKASTLEVTVLSAEDLRINGKPANKNVFVVVRAESLTDHTTTMKSNGGGGEGFHSWNEKFLVELGVNARSVTFEVKCKTETGTTKDIGIARIGVSDLLGDSEADSSLRFLSYRLRDWDGQRNGIIKFSVRVVANETEVAGSSALRTDSTEVVTGVPVWWNSSTDTSNV